jgi:hypothetical protein
LISVGLPPRAAISATGSGPAVRGQPVGGPSAGSEGCPAARKKMPQIWSVSLLRKVTVCRRPHAATPEEENRVTGDCATDRHMFCKQNRNKKMRSQAHSTPTALSTPTDARKQKSEWRRQVVTKQSGRSSRRRPRRRRASSSAPPPPRFSSSDEASRPCLRASRRRSSRRYYSGRRRRSPPLRF